MTSRRSVLTTDELILHVRSRMTNLHGLQDWLHCHFPEECPCAGCCYLRHETKKIKRKYMLA